MAALQNDRVLKYLKTHKKGITAKEAVEKLSIMRRSARIKDLRDEGWEIQTIWETGLNYYGDRVRYARYFLKKGA